MDYRILNVRTHTPALPAPGHPKAHSSWPEERAPQRTLHTYSSTVRSRTSQGSQLMARGRSTSPPGGRSNGHRTPPPALPTRSRTSQGLQLMARGKSTSLREKQWTLHTYSSTAPGHPKAGSAWSEDRAPPLLEGEAMDTAHILQHCPLQDIPRLAAHGQRKSTSTP